MHLWRAHVAMFNTNYIHCLNEVYVNCKGCFVCHQYLNSKGHRTDGFKLSVYYVANKGVLDISTLML